MSDTVLDNLRGINPLLSNLIVGVGGDQNYIAEQVLPTIITDALTVTYRKGSNAGLVEEGDINLLRAPGALPRKIDVSFGTDTMSLKQYGAMASVDFVEEQQGAVNSSSAIDYKLAKLAVAKSKVLLGKEAHVATLLGTAGNYTNSASNVDFGATTLRATIMAAKDTVRKASGYDPNTLILGMTAFIELLNNASIQDMIKYSSGGVTTETLIGQFFGVEKVVVGSAVKQTAAAAGASGTGTYIWTHDSAAMIYVNRNSPSPFNPSFAYLAQQAPRVFEWNNNPLITDLAYIETYGTEIGLASAGYLWTNVDQA